VSPSKSDEPGLWRTERAVALVEVQGDRAELLGGPPVGDDDVIVPVVVEVTRLDAVGHLGRVMGRLAEGPVPVVEQQRELRELPPVDDREVGVAVVVEVGDRAVRRILRLELRQVEGAPRIEYRLVCVRRRGHPRSGEQCEQPDQGQDRRCTQPNPGHR
jgi:hypothetical protein